MHPPHVDCEVRLRIRAGPDPDTHDTSTPQGRFMTIIQPGSQSPSFELDSHKGDRFSSAACAGKQNMLLVFYPLDFTPT